MVAPTLGTLPIGADVVWDLPKSILEGGQPICLAVFSLTDDSTNYFNAKGAKPPKLVVEYE